MSQPKRFSGWARRVVLSPFRALRIGLTSTDLLIRATVVAAMVLVAMSAYTLYVSAQGRAGIDAQRRSDEITACRSEYRAPIDQASDLLEAARVRRDDGLIAGLVAAVTDDDEGLADLIDEAEDIRAQTTQALAIREAATADYAAAVQLSRTDPSRFLQECRRRTRPT